MRKLYVAPFLRQSQCALINFAACAAVIINYPPKKIFIRIPRKKLHDYRKSYSSEPSIPLPPNILQHYTTTTSTQSIAANHHSQPLDLYMYRIEKNTYTLYTNIVCHSTKKTPRTKSKPKSFPRPKWISSTPPLQQKIESNHFRFGSRRHSKRSSHAMPAS